MNRNGIRDNDKMDMDHIYIYSFRLSKHSENHSLINRQHARSFISNLIVPQAKSLERTIALQCFRQIACSFISNLVAAQDEFLKRAIDLQLISNAQDDINWSNPSILFYICQYHFGPILPQGNVIKREKKRARASESEWRERRRGWWRRVSFRLRQIERLDALWMRENRFHAQTHHSPLLRMLVGFSELS